jgi:peptidoglycan/xylan/chitin deacetylase (PgdA/CDA1 family)
MDRVPNPFIIAAWGKGIIPMLARGAAIANRYGLTPTKIDNAMSQLSNTLEQFQCQATIPVTALPLSRNVDIARQFPAHGLELAVHGLSHVDYRLLSAEIQLDHIQQAKRIFEQARIPVTGFRSPYLRWNEDTLTTLKASGFIYDSSQALDMGVTEGLETSSYRRALEFYQAQVSSQHPALPRLDAGLVRIPYCLPDDEALVERLKITDSRTMAELWLAMLERTYEAGELFTLGLHPERVSLCQQALEAVLRKARSVSPRVWIARLDEIATWYQALGQVTFDAQQEASDRLHIKIQAPPEATILLRSLEVDGATEPWSEGYNRLMTNEFTVLNCKRPFIGLPSDTPSSLVSFLKHQGYLVEINANSQATSYYFECTHFEPEDERQMLVELNKSDISLLRLGRWPAAARSALAITGDIDAFTLWDYGRRILNN